MHPLILVVYLSFYPDLPSFTFDTYETEKECEHMAEFLKEYFPNQLDTECWVDA